MKKSITSRPTGLARGRGRITAALTVILLLGWGIGRPAAASAFRRLALSTVAFASDGSRYAAWQQDARSPIVAYDSMRRAQRVIAVPSGCRLASGEEDGESPAAAGRFLIECVDGWRLLDARAGALAALPAPGGRIGSWGTVGRRYVEGTADGVRCSQSRNEAKHGIPCIALYDLATGIVSYRAQSQVGDLDRAGAPPICHRLRSRVAAPKVAAVGTGRRLYSGGVLAERMGHGGDIRIERCDGHTTVLRGRGEPANLDIRGGILTWDIGHTGLLFEELQSIDVKHGTLFSYDLGTGRRSNLPLPRLGLIVESTARPVRDVLGYSTHTRNAVFWIAAREIHISYITQVETSSVFAAPLR